MKYIIGGFLAVLLVLPMVQGATLDVECSGGVYYERLWNNSALVYNNSFTCSDGCARNGLECNFPADPQIFIASAVGLGIIAFILAFLSQKVNKEHWPLQFLFLVFALAFIAQDIYLVSGYSELTTNSLNQAIVGGYNVTIWMILFLFTYFMFLLVKHLFEHFKSLKSGGKPFKPW